MKCVECNEVELEPSKGSRPRRFCSKKCAHRWHHKENYHRKFEDWGKGVREEKERQSKYKWCKENLLTAANIAEEYGISKDTVLRRAKLLEIEPERPSKSREMFYTKEQAHLIGTTETVEIKTKTAVNEREKVSANQRDRRADPVTGDKEREYQRLRHRKLRQEPKHRLRNTVSFAVYQALKKAGAMKEWSTFEKLGYSPEQLAEHIEKQFAEGMSWENYGTYWQVDHIIPQCALQYDTVEHPNFQKCWALENLRPLPRAQNASKGSRYNGKQYWWR